MSITGLYLSLPIGVNHNALFVARPVTVFHGFPLIIKLFAAPQANNHFRTSPFVKKQFYGNKRCSFSGQAANNIVNFFSFEQKFTVAFLA